MSFCLVEVGKNSVMMEGQMNVIWWDAWGEVSGEVCVVPRLANVSV